MKSDLNMACSLILAASDGNLARITKLVECGSDVNIQDGAGDRPLAAAVRAEQDRAAKLLVRLGADPDLPGINGKPAIFYPAARGNIETARFLLDAGADPNSKDETGVSVLMLSMVAACTNVAAILAERGADPNVYDKNGYTPLHLAAQMGEVSLMKKLIVAGADIYAPNLAGWTPLSIFREVHPALCEIHVEEILELSSESKRLKKEDKAGATATGYEFDI